MPWIDSNGISLRYELSGDAAPVIVLLHEMGGCLDSWNQVAPTLAKTFRVLNYDMRGAGLSEKPRNSFTIDDLADDLGGLLDALDLPGPVMLAGCAVGAAVAIHMAARAPQRVRCLVAMAPATGLPPEKKASVLQLADTFEAEGVRARIVQRFDHSYPVHYFRDPAQRAAVRGRLLSNDPYVYAATYRMLCGMDIEADFAKIQCPALVLAGRHDTTRPPSLVRAVADLIPNACFHVVDSGHAMNILSPDLVLRQILDFCAFCVDSDH